MSHPHPNPLSCRKGSLSGQSYSLRGCVVCVLLGALVALPALTGCKGRKVEPVKTTSRYQTLDAKAVPEFMKGTIFERVDVGNTEPFMVSGYGLIVNLDGTGDNTAVPTRVREYMIKQMVKHGFGQYRVFGYEKIQPEAVLADPRTAVVEVLGFIPPGARKNQRFDIAVQALQESYTSSLGSGSLYRTDLRINGANPRDPGGAVNIWAVGEEGQVFVNPAYALQTGTENTSVRASLRSGIVLDSGKVTTDRPLMMRLRQPQLSMSRAIENRVNQMFSATADVSASSRLGAFIQAEAVDEGIVQIYVPRSYNGDWERFANVITHTYLNGSPEFAVLKAKELADLAVKPDAPLLDISYCWEALGARALPYIVPLMSGEHGPDVAFAAARAAAYLGEPAAHDALAMMTQQRDHPFQLPAAQTLGLLPPSPRINSMVRRLLDSDQALLRIEAYKILARNRDPVVLTKVINESFVLDMVPSSKPSIVFATRSGVPRVAVIGDRARLQTPMIFSAMDNRLTITSSPTSPKLTIFYRNPARRENIRVETGTDLAELVARLGGQTTPGDAPLDFTYGDIVAILQRMSEQNQIVAGTGKINTPFILEEVGNLLDEIYGAPAIKDQGRPLDDAPGRPVDDAQGRPVEAAPSVGQVGTAK